MQRASGTPSTRMARRRALAGGVSSDHIHISILISLSLSLSLYIYIYIYIIIAIMFAIIEPAGLRPSLGLKDVERVEGVSKTINTYI